MRIACQKRAHFTASLCNAGVGSMIIIKMYKVKINISQISGNFRRD